MRLRSTLLAPTRQYAAAPVGDLESVTTGASGVDGDSWYSQLIGGGPDVNALLSGSRKFDVFHEMSTTDAAVKSLILLWTLPVRAAQWTLDPKDTTPASMVIRDACAWQFGLDGEEGALDLSWKELLAQGLRETVVNGPCIEELIWDEITTWRDADGDAHLIRPLARIALRPARTIQGVTSKNGRVVSVEQMVSGATAIPGNKVSYMVFERENNRWDGVSQLRSVWGPWMLKKQLMLAAGIGWDRFASGLPVVYHPENDAAQERAKTIGQNIRQHERAFVTLPSTGPPAGGALPESEWAVDLLNGASTLADPTPLLQFFNDEIASAGIQQFSRQGLGQTGARATSETQIDPYFLAVQELADYMRRERARQAIRRFVEVNFGVQAAIDNMPILRVSKLQARSITATATAISLLAAAGFTFSDRDTQNDVRDLLGLGQLPEAAEQMGVTAAQLEEALREAGLDPQQLAAVVNALPPDIGVQRNTVTPEGEPPATA